jgi:hypothetical protein
MGRPRTVRPEDMEPQAQEFTSEMPLEAPKSAPEAFLLLDPSSRPSKRLMRVHSVTERDRMLSRGWVLHG